METPPTHPCQGGCGQLVSGNKRKCLKCIDREIETRKQMEQFAGEFLEVDV